MNSVNFFARFLHIKMTHSSRMSPVYTARLRERSVVLNSTSQNAPVIKATMQVHD